MTCFFQDLRPQALQSSKSVVDNMFYWLLRSALHLETGQFQVLYRVTTDISFNDVCHNVCTVPYVNEFDHIRAIVILYS